MTGLRDKLSGIERLLAAAQQQDTPDVKAAVADALAAVRAVLRDLDTHGGRRRLPDERKALTHHFEIANFDGYITVGHYDDGTPGEVFIKIAKQGGTLSGLLDAFAIMVSIALQYGAPLHVITDKLAGMRFDPSGFARYPGIGYAKSLVDYIARWLAMHYLPPEERPKTPPPPLVSDPPPPPAAPKPAAGTGKAVVGGDGPPCYRCGSLMLRQGAGDCWACTNCGATSGSCGG